MLAKIYLEAPSDKSQTRKRIMNLANVLGLKDLVLKQHRRDSLGKDIIETI